MKRSVVVGLVAAPLLVGAAAGLGSLTAPPPPTLPSAALPRAASTPTVSLPADSAPAAATPASLPVPDHPPRLQAVPQPNGATSLTAGRWAVCYTYVDAEGDESVASPRYILTVPKGAAIRVAAIALPSGVVQIDYYVSSAANVVTNLQRYSTGDGTEVLVTGPGSGPIAPTG